ncbi:hypothetical protein CDL12_05732 [Handroanthus impetiginosus]|uniref:Retrotransposon Copia-like N-terminal domain-containing protein n=1 Tax=Handroanthus impetiginosus TaxID=429701 RepID=A0A2G9HVM1_9LAMI|nr:hypothetical protein CDL12_05732 [Handroanthus impetiginosus]
MTKNPLAIILETNKLIGPNYQDWLRNLKIILGFERNAYVLTSSPPNSNSDDDEETCNRISKWVEDDLQAWRLMMVSLTNKLQKQHEHMKHASDIYMHLQELYGVQMRYKSYKASKELFRVKMVEGSSVHEHGLKMIGLIEKITINELINMLLTTGSTMKKDKPIMIASPSKT